MQGIILHALRIVIMKVLANMKKNQIVTVKNYFVLLEI